MENGFSLYTFSKIYLLKWSWAISGPSSMMVIDIMKSMFFSKILVTILVNPFTKLLQKPFENYLRQQYLLQPNIILTCFRLSERVIVLDAIWMRNVFWLWLELELKWDRETAQILFKWNLERKQNWHRKKTHGRETNHGLKEDLG
jgi:hypothetical protein